ncbi:hypothetical protein [Virgibacillus sp. CBA3643]|uniref:hypothetical protein n=1 Tax=Virgibacillus sp. CBA3643 TaxID=2942278 RepID=UPI0035A37143
MTNKENLRIITNKYGSIKSDSFRIKTKDFDFLMIQAYKTRLFQEENQRYKQALEFYADKDNYEVDVINQWEPVRPVVKDNGEKARQALEDDNNVLKPSLTKEILPEGE